MSHRHLVISKSNLIFVGHYFESSLKNNFKSLNSYNDYYTNQYNMSLKIINNSNNEPIKEIFKIFMEIGKKIKNYLCLRSN